MILIESKQEVMSREVTHRVIDVLKHWKDYDFDGMIYHQIPIELFIRQDNNIPTFVRIIGITTPESISITITSKNDHIPFIHLSKISEKLSSIIRHEIEHYNQLQQEPQESTYDTQKIFSGDPSEVEQYLLNESEIEAFVSEIYYTSKKQHKSVNDIFKERIKPFIQSMIDNNVSQNEIKNILSNVKQIWFKYAMKRFPNVVLQ
jgi:hypothetical protein